MSVTRHLSRLHLWQAAFLLFGTSWLLAPSLNHIVSERATLISQYEMPSMPFAWLFRIGDIVAALLLVAALRRLHNLRLPRLEVVLMAIIVASMFLDPILSTTCRMQGNVCMEYSSVQFWLHAAETVAGTIALFGLSAYDALKRKAAPSILFFSFELLYIVLFISRLAVRYDFTTASQFMYQSLVIVWLAWFIAELYERVRVRRVDVASDHSQLVKRLFATWAAVNGFAAIVISLLHIRIFGFHGNGLYFAGNTAWLSQHGVVIGVGLLYISRHLARGEKRARQLFLFITAIEVLKYAVVSPHPILLGFYLLTFIVLFISASYFNRGVARQSWQEKFLDVLVIGAGVLAAIAVGAVLLSYARIPLRLPGHFLGHGIDVDLPASRFARRYLFGTLLRHTLAALGYASAAFILLSIFRPSSLSRTLPEPEPEDIERSRRLLGQSASSSEDYFKLWPTDKHYFWSAKQDGFVAYKVVGAVAFALPDPIAANGTQREQLLREFLEYCREYGLKACFLPVHQTSLDMYERADLGTVQIGSSAIINIPLFMKDTIGDKWWRWQRNRGLKSGYVYERLSPPYDSVLLQALQVVSNDWLADDRHEQGFAMGYFNTTYLNQCQIHVLKDHTGAIIAFANQVPIFNGLRQSTVDLIRYSPAAQNAMPFLLMNVIQSLAEQEQFDSFDLGFVPLGKMQNRIARLVRVFSAGRFSAAGLEQFKNKFDPQWRANYAAYDGDIGDLAIVALSLEKAMEPPVENRVGK